MRLNVFHSIWNSKTKARSLRVFVLLLYIGMSGILNAQPIYHYQQDNAHLIFFDKRLGQYVPHIVRQYEAALVLHEQLWDTDSNHYHIEAPIMLLTDWNDDGNAGVSAIPNNLIQIGMAPLNFTYNIAPSVERYHHLFQHEYTHVVMTDKATKGEVRWRKFLGGKFIVDNHHPFSALWSYCGVPRWYAPRWYHEGIACFLETWMGGGVGRDLGGYDEMYFRALSQQNRKFFSVVGLEAEGTTKDFQLGTNSYLYGTRFVNYLAYQHGIDQLISFYNHTNQSKKLFNRQFKQVYGTTLRKEWNSWINAEKEHQTTNLNTLKQYPITELKPLSKKTLGSVSLPLVDEDEKCIYVAVNQQGDFAHLKRIDLQTGKQKKLHYIDGPMLYNTSYVAFDKNHNRLIYTTQNGQLRGLRVYDIDKDRIVKRKKYQRVSNIVYDNTSNQLYGLLSNTGVQHIARYDSTLTHVDILYSFPFGQSVQDLDISHSGQYLSASINGLNGEQLLVRFDIHRLEKADFAMDTLYVLDDANLGEFRFTKDDAALIGTSYYTGVSNIWRYDFQSKEMTLMSNTDIGLFAPIEVGDSLIALAFDADGLKPVSLKKQDLPDANAITFFGQRTYEAHTQAIDSIAEYRKPIRQIEFGDVYHNIKKYNSFTQLRFTGAYPELSGFRDKEAFNQVTPVLGYRFQFSDPIGLHRLNFGLGISPWSHNKPKNQYHFDFDWSYGFWELTAAWNKSDFYDFFGPLMSSRNGWSVTLNYNRPHTLQSPFKWEWGAMLALYGDMDALPMYQNIDVTIRSFQYASAHIQASKMRTSLGGVVTEQGWSTELEGSLYLADRKLYPAITANAKAGFLVPNCAHLNFWLHGVFGVNFGDANSVFGNEYFGGFRNNYVDWRSVYRYRTLNAMPGADIDQISAHDYAKLTAEINLPPIRFNNFGFLNLYPTDIFASLFSSALLTNPILQQPDLYYNVGGQININIILFKYLSTTLSVGYARLWQYGIKESKGEWLLSIKLF